ncbi:MAG: hypothetical protein IAE98_04180 [Candidatus Kapabacteria bacterium]|nr:hypothetical protein [Candidatus Kapabacteria bacterium]
MKTFASFCVAIFCIAIIIPSQTKAQQTSQDYTKELARLFSQDLFESNGILFMQPVVKMINATSNSRFFSSAYIPQKVEKPYYRIGVQSMLGFVTNDLRSFTPVMPSREYNFTDLGEFIGFNILNGEITRLDTAKLIHYIFLNMMHDGIHGKNKGLIKTPNAASTAMGTGNTKFILPHESLDSLFKAHPLYSFPQIPQFLKDSINSAIYQFPTEFTLYGGNDLSTIFAAVPQIEIGSLYGTELLIRLIPPVDLGETVGDFAFWGLGLKHSISQYLHNNHKAAANFDEPINPYDIAVQVVYQGTSLKNTVGITKADLKANATIYNANIHGSYNFGQGFEAYTGLGYEQITINSTYTYFLPVEIQWQLGLLEQGMHEPTPGYPGDQNPQSTDLTFTDTNIKWTIGMTAKFGNFRTILDYSLSKFNVLSFGLVYEL